MIVHKPMEMNGDHGWMLLESGGTPTMNSLPVIRDLCVTAAVGGLGQISNILS